MSRVRQEISSVQFQVDSRKANASMEALQEKSKSLNTSIEAVKANIKALGEVKADNKQLLEYQKSLRDLTSDLKDVTSAQNELIKGVKAADKLWKAAKEGNIESLGVKSIKAGQRGLQRRMENLQPGNEADAKVLRAYKAVMEEADITILKFQTDAANTLEILENGGTVSARVMRETRDHLKELVDITPAMTAQWKEFKGQLDVMESKMSTFSETERRLAGEVVTVADAMKMAAASSHEAAEQRKADAEESLKYWQQTHNEYQTRLNDEQQHLENSEKEIASVQQQITEQENLVKTLEALDKSREKQNLSEEENKLNALKKKHEELTAALNTEKELFDNLKSTVKSVHDEEVQAAIEMAQAQSYSQKALEDSIAVLERQNKIETDPEEYKIQAESIEKMKQQIKEMTGEWMSYAEAEGYAQKIGTDDFVATTQQLQQATQALERQRDALIKTIQERQRDGQATAEEEEQLKRVTDNLKKMRFEMDNGNMSSRRMHEILKDPSSAKNLEELSAAVKRSTQELKLMEETIGKDNEAYKTMAEQTKNASMEQKKLESQFKATASTFEKAWSRLKTYVGLYVGAAVAMQKLTSTMGDLMELSDKMGEVRKTTGFTADEVGRLSGELKKLDTRTSITGLMELSAVAGQLGLKTEQEVRGFAEAANMLTVALPEMGKEGATAMLKVALATGEIDKIRQQMQEGIVDGNDAISVAMTKIGSTIDSLRANSAAAAPAITDFVKRVGAVGAQSGISIDQVAALGSTVDALGMRVEMSATALSRMIPAIKNNAFELSKAIGVTPEVITNLFDTGRGMEAILMILQHIKDSGADSESIEQMLGMGGMGDIMKDLNQQGARAGIVFAGLSQNVDELRRQLGIAKGAYEDNIAIQNEYNKMNDTTAAKWEKLKNQVEEMFVGDTAQRWLGNIIDGVRKLVDLLAGNTGLGVALKSIIVYLGLIRVQLASLVAGALKALWTGIKNIGIALGFVKGQMTAMQMSNIFLALAGAAFYLYHALKNLKSSVSAVADALAQAESEVRKETKAVDDLFFSVNKTNGALGDARKKLEEAKKANEDTADAEKELTKASAQHAATIREINSKYSSYLGYMLSETASAEQLAQARELINAKLRETITLKQKEAALGDVEQEFGGEANRRLGRLDDTIRQFTGRGNAALSQEKQAKLSNDIAEAAQKYAKDSAKFQQAVSSLMKEAGISGKGQGAVYDAIMSNAKAYQEQLQKMAGAEDLINKRFEARTKLNREKSKKEAQETLISISNDYERLYDQYSKASGEEKKKLAAEVYKQQRDYNNAMANNAEYFSDEERKGLEERLEGFKKHEKELRKIAGEAIRSVDAMERGETSIKGTDFTHGGESSKNPWGERLSGESTDWKNMTAEMLVQRRKQMKDFVNAIQTDTDVQSVLKQDTALKSAIEKGMSADMRTVIEWYNTERLKIQDELHARHLTNTGDWMDPKKAKGRKKLLRDEWRAYLEELDAYYTERKTRIQEAGTEEGITEAEVRNRTLANEMEWHQRRAELQKLYADKSAEVTEEEQQAIFEIIAERTEDSAEMVQKTIGKTVKFMQKIGEKSPIELQEALAKLGLGWERDFLKQQNAVTQQMKAIQDIIDKERPFNGITRNLRENLVTMGILTADMTEERNRLMKEGEDMADFNARQAAEEIKRTAFMIGEAENAYSLTIEDVMRHMADAGMQAWADELRKNPAMQEGLMAQLRSAYDAIQDAIKKEASLIRKQTDIWWSDIEQGQTESRKGGFEKMISRLGLQEDQVKRANQLIGAGVASERVADKLAISQMKIRLAMQAAYYAKMRQIGEERIRQLEEAGKLEDAAHLRRSLNLATTEELKKLEEQRVAIANQMEESMNRVYTELREYADLIYQSMQSVFEASHSADADYYNELAKLNLTGKGGPGAGTYVVIEDAGTSSATAHYEQLDERQALERQREIENQNAVAEAWKKLMDDLNKKMNDTITDQINAMLQNASLDANTAALNNVKVELGSTADKVQSVQTNLNDNTTELQTNTEALAGLTERIGELGNPGAGNNGQQTGEGLGSALGEAVGGTAEEGLGTVLAPKEEEPGTEWWNNNWNGEGPANGSDFFRAMNEQLGLREQQTEQILALQEKVVKGQKEGDKVMTTSAQSAFAKMTQAANLYGIAYQAMSNDNMSASQKFGMIAIQAAGQAAITSLTVGLTETGATTAKDQPAVLSKLWKQLGWGAIPVYALFTGLLGGLMGLAASKVGQAKSEIAQATGVGNVASGRLSTGMLTYAEGNVNEFTDPSTLTPGRQYNVDAANGKTYRARYMGKGAKTHITNGPEFHLVGEEGREAIIDAKTTRRMQMNETGIWHAIQTLYNGGRIGAIRRRAGRGMSAFADGNIDEFDDTMTEITTVSGFGTEQMAAFQSSLDRNNELLERALTEGIKGVFGIYGKDGLVHTYDQGKKTLNRYGQRY